MTPPLPANEVLLRELVLRHARLKIAGPEEIHVGQACACPSWPCDTLLALSLWGDLPLQAAGSYTCRA